MEPKPKRRRRLSRDLPPDLSELMNRLVKAAASFIKLFDTSEPRMTQIVGEFQKIIAEVKEIQQRTDRQRREARECAEAPFNNVRSTWGLSLLTVPLAAAAGTVLAVSANMSKILSESGNVKKVEALGTEFVRIVEPLKTELEEIKTTCEKLEQRSTELQAGGSLSDVEDFDRILRQVIQLGTKGGEVLGVTVNILGIIGDLVSLAVRVFRFTPSSEDDEKLRTAIIQSAEKCQKVLDNFAEMRKELKEFTADLH